jgi:hypothetical protein
MKALTLSLLFPLLCHASADEPVSLFDGKTLTGWKTVNPGNAKFWSVVDGVITGSNGDQKVPTNTYLATEKTYGDFEFRCEFRITGDHKTGLINSGIQYRSLIKDKKITGYQADIGRGYWGDIYDEHRRGKLVGGDVEKLKPVLKEEGWNSYLIRCVGAKHELFINDVKVAEYEEKADVPAEGHIGLQLHSGGVAKVEFKAVTVKSL